MAVANGRIATSNLTALPTSWSNKGRKEYLRDDAAASLSRALARAVAVSGQNFQIWDAYRSMDEQVAMLKRNYYAVPGGRRSGDRSYNGTTYRRRSGRPATASPGYSNHGTGLAIDVHPGGIQNWFHSEGRSYGWTWDEGRRLGESWHLVYDPALDGMKHEGPLDHGWVQKVVGATVDNKIGTGTVAKIREFQAAHGLTADGKVGANTKAAMKAAGGAPPARDEATGETVTAADLPTIETDRTSPNSNDDRRGHKIKHITLHWWGTPSGQTHDGIVAWLCDPDANVSAHYVVSPGRISRIVDEDKRSWANGHDVANSESITIECDPNDVAGTLPTVAALVADIFGRRGELPVHPHSDWTSTECCGDYRPLLPDLVKLAKGQSVTLTISPGGAAPSPSIIPDGTVEVDSRWGRETTAEMQSRLGVRIDGMAGPVTIKALQAYLGAPYVDGKISRQPEGALDLGNGYRRDCIEVGSGDSQLVRLWQAYVGATIDGRLGPETIERTQVQLNASPASFTADHASTVALRTKGVLDGSPTGQAPAFPLPRKPGALYYYGPTSGPKTSVSGKSRNTAVPQDVVQGGPRGWYSKGLKQWQAAVGITDDGRYGTGTESAAKALQRKRGLTVDGKIGPETWKAAWS